MSTDFLSPREELEIGVAISSELIDMVFDQKIDSSEIRSFLRDVVAEEGVGHTDKFFVDRVVSIIRAKYAPPCLNHGDYQ